MATVLVTGGGRGIGLGIVEALAADGWQIAFCGRSDEGKMEATRLTLQEKYAVKMRYYSCDVADLSTHQQLLSAILADFGELNALVNNAGVAPEQRNDLLSATAESFDRVLKINLRGPYFLTRQIAQYWAEQKQKKIDFQAVLVNIGSVSATVASPSRGEYCLSKAAVAMATQLWAVRLAEFGIAVYEVRPGVIHSDMTSVVTAQYDRLIADGLTLQPRWGEPADIGRAVRMLLRGDLAYSTGQVIKVDGGMEIGRL